MSNFGRRILGKMLLLVGVGLLFIVCFIGIQPGGDVMRSRIARTKIDVAEQVLSRHAAATGVSPTEDPDLKAILISIGSEHLASDPWDQPLRIGPMTNRDRRSPVIYSIGANGVDDKMGEDDISARSDLQHRSYKSFVSPNLVASLLGCVFIASGVLASRKRGDAA